MITYYSGSDGTVEADLPLATLGIKNNLTRKTISEETYYLRGYNNNPSSLYSNTAYNYERETGSVYGNNPTSWTGKIALPYPSDYGYAANFSKCMQALTSYNNSTCTSNNWMKSILSSDAWLLTPIANYSVYTSIVFSQGTVSAYSTISGLGVFPTLYLNPTTTIETGTTGTK